MRRGWVAVLSVLSALTTVGVVASGCDAAPHPAAPTVPSVAPTPVIGTPKAPAGPTVSTVTAADLGPSWRPGCPVGAKELRRVTVRHIGFDGQTRHGDLIVHRDMVPRVIAVFEQLHRLRFPIEKIRTAEHYPGAADELSMRDNNTSAFSCRGIPGSGNWSPHAYGRAIDVNPLLNPSVTPGGVLEPATAAAYLDRRRTDPGLLHDGDPAVRAFTDRTWRWGGHWRSPVDYQHFEWP